MVDSVDTNLPDAHEIGHSSIKHEQHSVHETHRRHDHVSSKDAMQSPETTDEAEKIASTRAQLNAQLSVIHSEHHRETLQRTSVDALTKINVAAHFLVPPKGSVIENPDILLPKVWKVAHSIDTLVRAYPQRTQQHDNEGHSAEVITLPHQGLLRNKTTKIISYDHTQGRLIRIEEYLGKDKLISVVTMPVNAKDAANLINDGQIFSNRIGPNEKRNVLQPGTLTQTENSRDGNSAQTQAYAMEAVNALQVISRSFENTPVGKAAQVKAASETLVLAA